MIRTAVVTRVEGATGRIAARALADVVDRLYLAGSDRSAVEALLSATVSYIPHEVADAASWDALAAQVDGPVSILVNGGADPDGASRLDSDFAAFATRARQALKGPWLGLRAFSPSMTEGGAVINVCAGAGQGAWQAEAEGLRLLSQAAVIDAHKAGRALRVNRLLYDPAALDEAALAAAVRALADGRTGFMTGADIVLTDACA